MSILTNHPPDTSAYTGTITVEPWDTPAGEWPSHKIDSIESLFAFESIATGQLPHEPHFLFRGQSNATWALRPSLLRVLPPNRTREDAIRVEQILLSEFKSRAHLHITQDSIPHGVQTDQTAEWWAVMQHYGAPTRLLDWTYSLYVALYFAVEDHWDCDGTVLVFNPSNLELVIKARHDLPLPQKPEFLINDEPPPLLFSHVPSILSARMVAQQGCFTISADVLADHGDIIERALRGLRVLSPPVNANYRIIIPANHKPSILRRLRNMNLTAHTLFPGADGLGKSMREIVKLNAASPKQEPTKAHTHSQSRPSQTYTSESRQH